MAGASSYQLKTVVFDARDHQGLARFYVALTGGEERYADDEWVTAFTGDGWRLGFQAAPDHVAPQWPDQAHPQQMHMDFQVADLDAATAEAEKLGARKIGSGDNRNVMADPAGHPFCLSANQQTEPIKTFGVIIDCPDGEPLSAFYAALLGYQVKYQQDKMAWIGTEEPAPMGEILFQPVTDYNPRSGRIRRTRSSCTSTSRSTTSTRPSVGFSSSVRPGCRATGRTGGSTPTPTITRSACSGWSDPARRHECGGQASSAIVRRVANHRHSTDIASPKHSVAVSTPVAPATRAEQRHRERHQGHVAEAGHRRDASGVRRVDGLEERSRQPDRGQASGHADHEHAEQHDRQERDADSRQAEALEDEHPEAAARGVRRLPPDRRQAADDRPGGQRPVGDAEPVRAPTRAVDAQRQAEGHDRASRRR